MTDEKLQAYFKFDDIDLEANRSGRFSEKQKARIANLNQSARKSRKIYGILGLCLGAGIIIGMPFLFRDPFLWYLWVFFGLISSVLGFYLLRTSPDQNKSYKLRRMQGVVKYSRHIQREHGRPVIGYWIMHVGKSWLNVAEEMPAILKEGAEYIVYTYASQGSTHVLSAEAVSNAEEHP